MNIPPGLPYVAIPIFNPVSVTVTLTLAGSAVEPVFVKMILVRVGAAEDSEVLF